MNETFLTVMEVAETLKLNPQTVRNWIDRGELRAVRVGSRRVRIRQSDLDALLAQGETLPLPSKASTPSRPSSVVLYRGISSPQLQRTVGPFVSAEAAGAWCEAQGLQTSPSDEEWAAVFPNSEPETAAG